MMFGGLGIGQIIGGVARIADDLFTSEEERLKVGLAEKQIEASLITGQLAINREEARHESIFVAGWRPAVGWVGAMALFYQFIFYPLLGWVWHLATARGWLPRDVPMMPVLDAELLWVVLSGMLGIAGMRSFDKVKGVASKR